MTAQEIVNLLHTKSNPAFREGMSRFGIQADTALGIKIPELRAVAKKLKKNHDLALELWATQIHEARLLAIFIDDFNAVSEQQMETWVKDFNSWDICDQACANLFVKTPLALSKAIEWSDRNPEFEKRAGFVMMAAMAVHLKKEHTDTFRHFFPIIEREAFDDRNFVKKAVNWALRQIGKRNAELKEAAITTAERIQNQDTKSAYWIATDALRELRKNYSSKDSSSGRMKLQ